MFEGPVFFEPLSRQNAFVVLVEKWFMMFLNRFCNKACFCCFVGKVVFDVFLMNFGGNNCFLIQLFYLVERCFYIQVFLLIIFRGKARLKHETISFQDIFHVPIEPHSVTKMLTENRGIFHFNNDQIFFIKMERE